MVFHKHIRIKDVERSGVNVLEYQIFQVVSVAVLIEHTEEVVVRTGIFGIAYCQDSVRFLFRQSSKIPQQLFWMVKNTLAFDGIRLEKTAV